MYNYNLGLLFYSIAAEISDYPAIRFIESRNVTYGELNNLSNQLGRYLLDIKIEKTEVVGIFNNKTLESYAMMIACLKTGIIYVNLDNLSPFERLRKIIDRCNPVLLVYDQDDTLSPIADFAIPIQNICSESFRNSLKIYSKDDIEITSSVCSDNPAYIMFTSGSTGFPKGAVMTHQNLLNFINWTQQTYHITRADILTNVNPMYFDNSVFDFYASLFNGASMAPIDSDTVKQPLKLVASIGKIKATIWFSVPSLLVFLITMKALTKEVFKDIRVISFGGEGFPKPKLKILFDLFAERIRIVNVYGPTECTCICSAYDLKEDDFDDLINLASLGFIAPNFDYLILNEDGEKAKSGELLLGGPQVGLGYYNDPERTAQSFIQNPFEENYQNVYYKTGDIVDLGDDGIIQIKGRSDNQIKYMGYRIELEEIEAGFNALQYINEAGVVYEKYEDGLGQIKAFVTLKFTVPVESVREDIKKMIPAYMVPKKILILENMPKNPNGKIDRLALKNL